MREIGIYDTTLTKKHSTRTHPPQQQQQQPPPTFLQAPLSLCFVLFFPSGLLAYCVANPIAQKDIETHKTKANKQTMGR
jgi:hypothetical protein